MKRTIRDALISALIAGGDTYAAEEIRRGAPDALMTVERRTREAGNAAHCNRRRDDGAPVPQYARALACARGLATTAAYLGLDVEVQQ